MNSQILWSFSIIVLIVIVSLAASEVITRLGNEYNWTRRLIATISVAVPSAGLIVLQALYGLQSILLPRNEAAPVRETVRDFLAPKESEPAGLGLYSYLLITNPGGSNYERKIAAIKAYLSNFTTYDETGPIKNPIKFNGFFVFTKEDAEWIDQCSRTNFVYEKTNDPSANKIPAWSCKVEGKKKTLTINDLAEWVVPRLDYGRTSHFVAEVAELGIDIGNDGIYIFSYKAPVQKLDKIDGGEIILQDLSKLPLDYMESWIKLTAQEFERRDYWDKDTLDYSLLSIRTMLAEAAPAVTLTEKALASEIGKRIWPFGNTK